jgi:hypothetical protein
MVDGETLITFRRFELSLETIQMLFAQTEISTASILLVVL